ncbi:MAG TPA: NifU family protein [Polyangiaceae bacterium]|jgi:Fe-S cluster biogenesis protein NfuA
MGKRQDAIERVVREVIAPLVRADGGELFLVQATDASVSLHLSGRFAGCPGNTLATRRVITPAIHAVAPETEVIVTSGVLVPGGAIALRCKNDLASDQ